MGFKFWLLFEMEDNELYVITSNDGDYFVADHAMNSIEVPASEFLNTAPPNLELVALKQRLMEIADSAVELTNYNKERVYFAIIHDYINLNSETHCTDLATLIIKSDL